MREKCLDFIDNNSSFQEKFVIKLVPNKTNWKLCLHLDSIAWFDTLISQPDESGILMSKKQENINSIRSAYYLSPPESFYFSPIPFKFYKSSWRMQIMLVTY